MDSETSPELSDEAGLPAAPTAADGDPKVEPEIVNSQEAGDLPSNDSDVILEVRNLNKSFGKKKVLKDVSFKVNRGEIYGFIGPNGAGKTTTIRILSTLLYPDQGELWIDDHHVLEEPELVRKTIGYMPDYIGVYPGLTVLEYLEFFAAAYRILGSKRKAILNDVIELTELSGMLESEVQVLSKGMRQRLCLAQTLIHDPDLLILDEPASGLDPRARIEFRALLKELRNMGKTIFLSSHILTELSPICDSVGIIEQGELVTSGGVQEILAGMRGDSVNYQMQLVQPSELAVDLLRTHPKVKNVVLDGVQLKFRYEGPEEDLHNVFALLVAKKISFVGLKREEADLESIFMRLTRGEVA